jgi:predicted nucleic acid-binding protein
VIYLLDVNVLLAASYTSHYLHERADGWLKSVTEADTCARLATCSVTELGFVRIACGGANLARGVSFAQRDLIHLKAQKPFIFLDDSLDANLLPPWVERSKQVTDGHLLQLATTYSGTLVTLDEGIPGALLIPKDSLFVKESGTQYGVAA